MDPTELSYEDLCAEAALPLVTIDEVKKEFVVNKEAIDFLKTIDSPLGVIAVAGLYRTGKSYLLNRVLLNRNSGFGVGNTVNACTKGLWVWKKTIKGTTPDGEEINVLIVDSEGLGAFDEDSNHDSRIFSLAILLSSYFIYNSVGSIDENALNSLSFVISLTKHIQIKSSGMAYDTDPEEYSQYFPSFMWVVRDFALQLVDSEGEIMTPKDYLEKALMSQKGFSEAAEQKNRIRRLLKCFFKERDCCVIVRPLTQEGDLQTLETKDFESLRDEFKQQVIQLRSKVMKRIRPKTILNGQKVNGSMLAGLISSYVDAINKGAVPSIENAWSYISKSECQKAVEKAYEHFVDELMSSFEMSAPVYEDELLEMFKEAKASAIKIYDQNSVGEVAPDFKTDLKLKFKQKYSQLKAENEKEAQNQAQIYLQNYFTPIEDKLRNQKYATFSDFERDIKEIEQLFMDRGPPGPNRKLICQNYIISALIDGCDYFLRSMSSELKLQSTMSEESRSKYEARIQELKGDLVKTKDDYEVRLRTCETEKAQSIAKEQSARESLNELKREKENSEKEYKTRMQSEKSESLRQIEEYKNRMYSSEEAAKEAQRRMLSSESESDKQKALLEQKITFMENTIETLKQKDKENQSEIKTQKKELLTSIKENSSKYEEKIASLNRKIEQLAEELGEKDNKISEFEQKDYLLTSTINEKDIELESLREVSSNYDKLKDDYDRLKKDLDDNRKVYNQELQDERDTLIIQIDELKQSIAQNDTEYGNDKNKWEKDSNILQQKIDFLNSQLQDTLNQIDENRKTHEAMIKALQSRESEKGEAIEEADKKIEELRQSHYQEMKELEERYDTNNKRLTEELNKLRKSESDFKMQLKITTTEKVKEIADLTEALAQSETLKDRAMKDVKQLETQKQSIIQQTEDRYKATIKALEQELEQKEEKAQTEVGDMRQRSENDLAQLKSYYEAEKDRLEKRLQEEKDKGARNLKLQQSEYEQRMMDDQQQHEDDMESIQEELRDKDYELQQLRNQYEHDSSLNAQKISSLENHIKENKKAFDDAQEKHTKILDQQINSFNNERKEMMTKIDEFSQLLTEKEKRITALENQNESLISQSKKKDEDIDGLRVESGVSKRTLEETIDRLRAENQTTSDELMQRKLEAGREQALTQQKIEFQEKKIEDLLKALSDCNKNYQEKLDTQKNEFGQEIDSKIYQLTTEKEKIAQRFEDKRKELKELEKNNAVLSAKYEREKAVFIEKIENLERKITNEQENHQRQIENYREKIAELQDQGSKSVSKVEQKFDELKDKYNSLEKERNDLVSKYEKDEILWRGKHDFLEEQKTQVKKELTETYKKLEAAIEQLQNKGNKGDQEKKQLDAFKLMEREYKDQIANLQESHEKYAQDMIEKNKELDSKYHSLQEKYEVEYRESNGKIKNLENKLNDLEQRERGYLDEISNLRQQKDKMYLENQSVMEKEREQLKQKIGDLERRCKTAESDKSSLKFEIEKEKSRLTNQIDYLENTKSELQDQINKIMKRNESLIAQNEKLKEKNKTTRKLNKYGGAGGSSYLESSTASRIANKFLGIKELDQESYTSQGIGAKFGSFTKFIGDGEKIGSSKKSEIAFDECYKQSSLHTPDRFEKNSDSTNTLSPQDEKE